MREKLELQLSDYPNARAEYSQMHQVQFGPGQQSRVAMQDLGWQGLTFTSPDRKQIVKFQKQLFSFSRLAPYPDWKTFKNEALRLWSLHRTLTSPLDVQRLGVRFINRIPLPNDFTKKKHVRINNYFRRFSIGVEGFNMNPEGFLHHEILAVPGNKYAMNIIKTIQPAGTQGTNEAALILDIDVYAVAPFAPKDEEINSRLQEMDWLKNKVFFGTITKQLQEQLR
ncbi:hypothetical protein A2V82_09410 [candidate division KSB1 bacterium RBG_16_48_16]|nr:MAG: hypothetical protein A2V82_09410 [candidate division KSB1 bacterium RBG_16_48_16]